MAYSNLAVPIPPGPSSASEEGTSSKLGIQGRPTIVSLCQHIASAPDAGRPITRGG